MKRTQEVLTVDGRRLLALVVASALGLLGAARLATDAVTVTHRGSTFSELLVAGAAVAALLASAWWSVLVGCVAIDALARGRLNLSAHAAPEAWRRAVLGLCGAAVIIGAGTSAHAADGNGPGVPSLDGLRLPERAQVVGKPVVGKPVVGKPVVGKPVTAEPARTSPAVTSRTVGPVGTDQVRVRAGDSLWSIAATLLPQDATPTQVAALTARLYDTNRTEVGNDPDLIHPGMQLRVPAPEEE